MFTWYSELSQTNFMLKLGTNWNAQHSNATSTFLQLEVNFSNLLVNIEDFKTEVVECWG